jgi:pimeloyl-ACP methyl ester carboxylesterase
MTSNMQARRKSRPIPVSVGDLPRFSSVAVEIRSPLGQRILQDQNYLGFLNDSGLRSLCDGLSGAMPTLSCLATRGKPVKESFMSQARSTQTAKSSGFGKTPQQSSVPVTSIHTVEADGVRVFYRAAGDPNAPVVLLLHGFPTSSFMFRELIPRLADDYRLIAPDLPGFGFTEVPAERNYVYSFDRLAATINAFTQALKLRRYALYVFDYGAPTGFRLAMAHPDRVTAIVSQNGNAYEEGLGDAWAPIRKYWAEPTSENREVIRKNILTLDGTRWQYTHGVANPESVPPESYTLDTALLERPGNKDIQLDLFLDYASNVKLYRAFQDYFRKAKPPLLAIWGKNDPFFIPAGAEAFRTDIPNARVEFLDTGHFAVETHVLEIAAAMKEFLRANGAVQ